MGLRDEQSAFAWQVARLIAMARKLGYEVTLGEAWRTAEQARWYAARGMGTVNSLHCSRLAVDINLFRGGTYLQRVEDYAVLGAWWKAQDPAHRWGGDFTLRDATHFSRSWQGRA